MSKEKAEKNIQEALNYIRLDFKNLGVIIGQYHPLEILKMAAWEERRITRTRPDDQAATASARLLPVLLQSVVQSTSYDVSHGISSNRNIRDKDWQRIRSLSEDVSKRLIRSLECYAVLAVKSGKVAEENALRYRELLFEEAFPPAEDLERIERFSYMTYVAMKSDDSVIKEKYGTDSVTLVDQVYRIAKRGLEGIDRLSEESTIYKSEVETLMAQKRSLDPTRIVTDEDLMHEVIKENGWEGRVSRLAGERDDFDLFRPEFAANLPSRAYETLSVEPGTLDLDGWMLKGLWPATVYPFIRFGNMYFSFVAEHMQSYGLRILQETAGLSLRYTEATIEAMKLLFREGDEGDVYLFDGNKIDVSILSSLEEVNSFTSPELFQLRMVRRKEEAQKKPRIGHKALIIEPDDFESLRKIGDDVFSCSAYCIIRASEKPEAKKEFCKTIFGQLEMPEPTEYDAIIDPEEIEDEEKIDDDVLSDDITDEYEYEAEDEDESEKRIEEKEKLLEESIPEDDINYERSAEIEKLKEKYALTSDIIRKDEEAEAEADEYEKELDDDDFIYDEPESDDMNDDIDPEAERIYDEAEAVDEYADDSTPDPDQLTFFDELFSDDEMKEADRIADDEFAAEDEEAYEKAEKEAEEFSSSEREVLPNSAVLDEDVSASEESLEDFPCFGGKEDDAAETENHGEIESPDTDEATETPEKESTEEKEETAADNEIAAESSSSEDAAVAPEEVPEEAVHDDEGKEAKAEDSSNLSDDAPDKEEKSGERAVISDESSTQEESVETTETLIDKGLVKPVELAGGGKVFVMTENAFEIEEEKEEEEPVVSRPELTGILREISLHLDEKESPFMSFLSHSDSEMHDYLSRVIKSSWERQLSDGKDKMFSIFDYSISVILSAGRINDSLRRDTLLNNAGAVMYSRHKTSWNALVLSINDDFEIVDVYEKSVTPDSFSPANWKICRVIGEQLIARSK